MSLWEAPKRVVVVDGGVRAKALAFWLKDEHNIDMSKIELRGGRRPRDGGSGRGRQAQGPCSFVSSHICRSPSLDGRRGCTRIPIISVQTPRELTEEKIFSFDSHPLLP
jgi:hypothetical protein